MATDKAISVEEGGHASGGSFDSAVEATARLNGARESVGDGFDDDRSRRAPGHDADPGSRGARIRIHRATEELPASFAGNHTLGFELIRCGGVFLKEGRAFAGQ